ncbi:MAG TPA: glycosyltransferase family A protein [Rhizomicrobium sp.]|nr:glycosyltransferase family A protein [Rhizomicrobium sp.]
MNRATILIPTTGAPVVRQAIESCLAQSYGDLQVLAVVDGSQHREAFAASTKGLSDARYESVVLPENVGAENYYGHRIYGGFSHLVNAHYLLFLDQDNFFDPDHVSSQVENIEKNGLDWSYSLRKVCDLSGNFVARDDSESLGTWPSLGGYRLIDTNCYCLKLQTAIGIAAVWFGNWGQDRRVTEALIENYPKYACTGRHTVNYRLRDEKGHEFFIKGGARMRQDYPGGFPWVAKL